MSLRWQLAIVSLLMAVLPWAGYHYVNDMAAALRAGLGQSLASQSQAIASRLGTEPALQQYTNSKALDYIPHLHEMPLIDGYEDWHGLRHPDSRAEYSAEFIYSNGYLVVLLKVIDDTIHYHNPSSGKVASGDYVNVQLADKHYVLRTSAPGEMQIIDIHQRRRSFAGSAYLLETPAGYTVELRLPVQAYSHLKLTVADAKDSNQQGGHFEFNSVYFYQASLAKQLSGFAQAGQRLQIVDQYGYLLAQQQGPEMALPQRTHGLLVWLYKKMLQQPAQHELPQESVRGLVFLQQSPLWWFSRGRTVYARQQMQIGDHAQPFYLVLEQSSEGLTQLTSGAFSRLFMYTLLTVAAALVMLLGYASWLSLRIRRLSQAASTAVQDDGRLNLHLPNIKAGDEIGDMARNFQTLLQRVEDYNQYLRTLADKLSHELRTPIAVINGSLENLRATHTEATANQYIQRAQDASARLSSMLMAMSAAKRLEDSLQHAVLEPVALHELIEEMSEVYQQTYPAQRFSVMLEDVTIDAADELIVQMLDKLIDNASSFTPEHGSIQLHLHQQEGVGQLIVSNDGPLLPEGIRHHIFNSLVSKREAKASDDNVHMGLGLTIVKLICDFHGAEVLARNRADETGVEFVVLFQLPKQ